MSARTSPRAALLMVRGFNGGIRRDTPTTGGVIGEGQSERLRPDPRRSVRASQAATDRPAGAHDRTGPKRWTGSVEQELHAEGIGTAALNRVGSRPMPFAPNLTIEQVSIERRK